MAKVKQKYPPYGRLLADRQRFNNLPSLVIIGIGGNAWTRAKAWLKHPDFAALVVPQDLNILAVAFPVVGCLCLVEWGAGAVTDKVIQLVKILLESGAVKVIVSPLSVDYSVASEYWDTEQQRFIKARESMMAYYPWAVA